MKQMTAVKKIALTAICMALCVVLPQTFHIIPDAGTVICPMHIPVLLCGLMCGWEYGLICGLAGPVLSCLLTGMPPIAILPSMMLELTVYGGVIGILFQVIRTGRIYVDLYASLLAAMLAGRIVAGISKALIFAPGAMTMPVWVTTYFVTALPGIIFQLVLIPNLVFTLMKARVIPGRYQKEKADKDVRSIVNG